MFSPQRIERMIERTGGVPVVIGDVATWGHLDPAGEAFGAGGGKSADGGTPPSAQMLRIPARITEDPPIGGQIQVDGAPRVVRALRKNEPGDELLILLAERTHTLSIYRRFDVGTEDDYGASIAPWAAVVTGIAANLEPVSGGVDQESGGRTPTEKWRGFIPPGITVEPDDRILVTAGPGPERLRVTFVAEHGPDWDTEIELVTTMEVFP